MAPTPPSCLPSSHSQRHEQHTDSDSTRNQQEYYLQRALEQARRNASAADAPEVVRLKRLLDFQRQRQRQESSVVAAGGAASCSQSTSSSKFQSASQYQSPPSSLHQRPHTSQRVNTAQTLQRPQYGARQKQEKWKGVMQRTNKDKMKLFLDFQESSCSGSNDDEEDGQAREGGGDGNNDRREDDHDEAQRQRQGQREGHSPIKHRPSPSSSSPRSSRKSAHDQQRHQSRTTTTNQCQNQDQDQDQDQSELVLTTLTTIFSLLRFYIITPLTLVYHIPRYIATMVHLLPRLVYLLLVLLALWAVGTLGYYTTNTRQGQMVAQGLGSIISFVNLVLWSSSSQHTSSSQQQQQTVSPEGPSLALTEACAALASPPFELLHPLALLHDTHAPGHGQTQSSSSFAIDRALAGIAVCRLEWASLQTLTTTTTTTTTNAHGDNDDLDLLNNLDAFNKAWQVEKQQHADALETTAYLTNLHTALRTALGDVAKLRCILVSDPSVCHVHSYGIGNEAVWLKLGSDVDEEQEGEDGRGSASLHAFLAARTQAVARTLRHPLKHLEFVTSPTASKIREAVSQNLADSKADLRAWEEQLRGQLDRVRDAAESGGSGGDDDDQWFEYQEGGEYVDEETAQDQQYEQQEHILQGLIALTRWLGRVSAKDRLQILAWWDALAQLHKGVSSVSIQASKMAMEYQERAHYKHRSSGAARSRWVHVMEWAQLWWARVMWKWDRMVTGWTRGASTTQHGAKNDEMLCGPNSWALVGVTVQVQAQMALADSAMQRLMDVFVANVTGSEMNAYTRLKG